MPQVIFASAAVRDLQRIQDFLHQHNPIAAKRAATAIIQSGISEVVYYGDKYHDSDSSVAARFMFKKAGVKLTAYQSTGRKAELEL